MGMASSCRIHHRLRHCGYEKRETFYHECRFLQVFLLKDWATITNIILVLLDKPSFSLDAEEIRPIQAMVRVAHTP
jgi:hypothetical protein